jgi:glycosyltransferase involved in cell wall biosynthesis
MPTTDQPAFSVIMPVYNHVDYVGAAVQSVIDQTRRDWELILVDDGSTDGSVELVKQLAAGDDRITVLCQPNAGPAAARNTALAVAKADWLTYIDSDDVWLTDALENYGTFIAANPETTFIYGFRHRLNPDATITELTGEFQDAPTGAADLFGRMYLSHLCVCYRRELIEKAGPYDSALRSCEDYELYLRMSLHCRFNPLGKATGLRRRHDKNLSRQTGHSRFQEAQILQRFVQQQGGDQLVQAKLVRRRLGRLYYASSRQYFKEGAFRHAFRAARRANRYRSTFKSVGMWLMNGLLFPLDRRQRDALPILV